MNILLLLHKYYTLFSDILVHTNLENSENMAQFVRIQDYKTRQIVYDKMTQKFEEFVTFMYAPSKKDKLRIKQHLYDSAILQDKSADILDLIVEYAVLTNREMGATCVPEKK